MEINKDKLLENGFYLKSNNICVSEDVKDKEISDPEVILDILELVAYKSYGLDKETVKRISDNAEKTLSLDAETVMEHFCSIMVGINTGKALRIMAEANLMSLIIGEYSKSFSRIQVESFYTLASNIDKTHRVLERRLGLFYRILSKKDALSAITKLPYDPKIVQNITDGITQLEFLHFMRDKIELKNFIFNYGMERYEYIHNLSKAERIIYNTTDIKIQNRIHLLKDIQLNNEAIFVEDLKITAQDLVDSEICSLENAPRLLELSMPFVHRSPRHNNKKDLLKHARRLSKSRFRRIFSNVKWIK